MHCGSDKLTWVTATGRGVIYSYTIIHQNKSPEFVQDTPYNVAIIQLAEGPRMMSNVVGISPQDLRIDLPVKIVLDPVTDTISIPRFAPLA
jgi:hypothetical protein